MQTNTVDAKTHSLKPGERVEISRYGDTRCIAERSGDGKTLKFIRETQNELTILQYLFCTSAKNTDKS